MSNCKVTGPYSFPKGLFQVQFQGRECACLIAPPPRLSFKKLPSPTHEVRADGSLRVGCPGSCGQGDEAPGQPLPGLTVDSANGEGTIGEIIPMCEGKQNCNRSKMDGFFRAIEMCSMGVLSRCCSPHRIAGPNIASHGDPLLHICALNLTLTPVKVVVVAEKVN